MSAKLQDQVATGCNFGFLDQPLCTALYSLTPTDSRSFDISSAAVFMHEARFPNTEWKTPGSIGASQPVRFVLLLF